jgi:hypothetical protein
MTLMSKNPFFARILNPHKKMNCSINKPLLPNKLALLEALKNFCCQRF